MPAPKLQIENGTILTTSDVAPQEFLARTFGRSSPPYGLVTSSLKGETGLGHNLAPIDDHACTQIVIAEPDPLKPATAAVDSPCIGVCSTTFDEVCIGCGRTVSEVAQWAVMTDDQKQLVWQRIVLKGFPSREKRNPLS